MQQFGRAFADDVHAQQFFGIGIENQLQPPGSVAANLAARDLPEKCDAYFVGDAFFGQLLFSLAMKEISGMV